MLKKKPQKTSWWSLNLYLVSQTARIIFKRLEWLLAELHSSINNSSSTRDLVDRLVERMKSEIIKRQIFSNSWTFSVNFVVLKQIFSMAVLSFTHYLSLLSCTIPWKLYCSLRMGWQVLDPTNVVCDCQVGLALSQTEPLRLFLKPTMLWARFYMQSSQRRIFKLLSGQWQPFVMLQSPKLCLAGVGFFMCVRTVSAIPVSFCINDERIHS